MKKPVLISIILLMLFATTAYPDATSITSYKVGINGNYVQAETEANPVLHYKVNATITGDTINYFGVYNTLNSWYIGAAIEPDSIAAGSVKLWYTPVDSDVFDAATAQFVAVLPLDSGSSNWWYNDSLSWAVVDGSGLWVTIDVPSNPQVATLEFRGDMIAFQSGLNLDTSNAPSKPAVLMITQTTPAKRIEILHTGGTMQTYVSTGQENIIPMELSFYNNSGTQSAPVMINSLSLNIKSYSPFGTMLIPSDIIESIKIQNKSTGTIYGQLSSGEIPSTADGLTIPISLFNVPAETTITASIAIKITVGAAAAGQNFIFTLESPVSLTAKDYYTGNYVTPYVSASDTTGFPMNSNFATIQKQSAVLNADYSDVIPANINKGQPNVQLMKIHLRNPGDSNTSAIEVYGLKFSLRNSDGEQVIPSSLFSKISITDESGSIIYGLKQAADIETSGDIISFALLNTIGINAASSATITVRADIFTDTTANNFIFSLTTGSSVLARDKNSFSSVILNPSPDLPFDSGLAVLSSSLSITNSKLMPGAVYSGQTNVPLMRLDISSPIAFGSGNIILRGITLTAAGGANLSSMFKKFSFITPDGSFNTSAAPAAPDFYIAFPQPLTIPALGCSVSIFADLTAGASGKIEALISAPADIDAYQDNDPMRYVYVAAAFPLSSGIGYISGDSSSASFTNYPNPFTLGNSSILAYFLKDPSTVTIKIYSVTGGLIRTIISEVSKPAGSRSEDTWDGRDDAGRYVLAGTYVVKLEIKTGGKTDKSTRRITFVK